MGLVNPPIPKLGKTGPGPAQDLIDSLDQIIDEINGNLDNANLAPKSINADKSPIPKWSRYTVTPEARLVGGAPIPGLEDYLYGLQQITLQPLPAAPADPSLREVEIEMIYSKSSKFSGGNDSDNHLTFAVGELVGGYVGLSWVPGSAGVVSRRRVVFNPQMTAVSPGTIDTTGRSFVAPTRGSLSAQASGVNGPFSGVYTIHEITIRYRDWEF